MGDWPTYLIGLSGPPRSGKDTLGNLVRDALISRQTPAECLALSLPMRHAVYGMLGMAYSDAHYDRHKDDTFTVGHGRTTTIRQEMIALSEHHIKPRLGHGWWARALINRMRLPKGGVLIITDMGFAAEHDTFVEEFGAENCAWFHIHRNGHDFSNDSRSYVGKGSNIYNNDNPTAEALRIVGRLLNQHHWSV